MWKFCLHSLFREYGWQFVRKIAVPHPIRTIQAVLEAGALDFAGECTEISNEPLDPRLEGGRSIVGVGFCMKPVNPPCPSGRSNHDCSYLEHQLPSEVRTIPLPCRQCPIKQLGMMALHSGAAFYIMTSAQDILFDVFVPALAKGGFSSGLFVLCRYSLMPFAVGMLASNIRGWLCSFEKGDCRDYQTWLLADRGIKEERTQVSESAQKMIMDIIARTVKGPDSTSRFEKRGNIFFQKSDKSLQLSSHWERSRSVPN